MSASAGADAVMELPAPGTAAERFVVGEAGLIECQVSSPRETARGFAVICHPHPLFGGAMSNKVVYSLGSTALKHGLVSVRFNFRGVGKSQGVHDQGRGETRDCLAVVAALRATMPPGAPLLLAGFSFGAFVSLSAARSAGAAALVSIALPFGRYFDGAANPPHPGCPWMALHSRDDDTVPYAETMAILDSYSPSAERISVDGAGHFFHGRLKDIQDAVTAFLALRWSDMAH
ncbi:MAG: alpha/beta hydrolase [Panacagrimonas sp.]